MKKCLLALTVMSAVATPLSSFANEPVVAPTGATQAAAAPSDGTDSELPPFMLGARLDVEGKEVEQDTTPAPIRLQLRFLGLQVGAGNAAHPNDMQALYQQAVSAAGEAAGPFQIGPNQGELPGQIQGSVVVERRNIRIGGANQRYIGVRDMGMEIYFSRPREQDLRQGGVTLRMSGLFGVVIGRSAKVQREGNGCHVYVGLHSAGQTDASYSTANTPITASEDAHLHSLVMSSRLAAGPEFGSLCRANDEVVFHFGARMTAQIQHALGVSTFYNTGGDGSVVDSLDSAQAFGDRYAANGAVGGFFAMYHPRVMVSLAADARPAGLPCHESGLDTCQNTQLNAEGVVNVVMGSLNSQRARPYLGVTARGSWLPIRGERAAEVSPVQTHSPQNTDYFFGVQVGIRR